MNSGEIRAKAIKREASLAEGFTAFSKSWSFGEKGDCSLNRGLLLQAMESYFIDIERLKTFHGIEYADSHKRAGYTVKWLMRFRPIQYHTFYVTNRRTMLANESFAFWIACEHLGVDLSILPNTFVESCLYHLRFRSFEPDCWAISFYLLQAQYSKKLNEEPNSGDLA